MQNINYKSIAFSAAVTRAFEQRALLAWSLDKWDALQYMAQVDKTLVSKYWDVFGSAFKLETVDFGHFHPADSNAKCTNLVYFWTVGATLHEIKVCIVNNKVGFVQFDSILAEIKHADDEFDYAELFEREIAALPEVDWD